MNRYGDRLAIVCCDSSCCHGDHSLSSLDWADQRRLGHFDRLRRLRGWISIDKEAATGRASRGRAVAVMEQCRGWRNSCWSKINNILKYEHFICFYKCIKIILRLVTVLVSFKVSHLSLLLRYFCWTHSCWECVCCFLNCPPGVEEVLPVIHFTLKNIVLNYIIYVLF